MGVDKVHGNLLGVKKAKQEQIAKLYRRRVPADQIITQELSRELAAISHELGKQVGVFLNRRGQVEQVMVGDKTTIMLPELGRSRGDQSRFRGLRYVHTHLGAKPLDDEDLTDLALLRFDLILAVNVDENGYPAQSHLAHLLPDNPEGKTFEIYPPIAAGRLDLDFTELITELEREFQRARPRGAARDREGVILIGTTKPTRSRNHQTVEGAQAPTAIDAMGELRELARSAGVEVLDQIVQTRRKIDPRTVLGPGKLKDVIIRAMQLGAGALVFDRELSATQVGAIQKATDLKVIDRSQLILDVFAQRAKTKEGKIQVELAQLQYNLPRLVGKGVDMSRLMGGIGGRGPGETKLEVDRRRVRERVQRLERELKRVGRAREQKRERRKSRQVPVVSIIGYANAGKSTLLNQLTQSQVEVEDKMFATLDPASRRLRFPREREIVITDTVGFIHELPRELYEAFRSTLEELADADLFLHLVDASAPSWQGQIKAVEKIIDELDLGETPRVVAFNKTDLVEPDHVNALLAEVPGSVGLAALKRNTFMPLLLTMEHELFREQIKDEIGWQSLGF